MIREGKERESIKECKKGRGSEREEGGRMKWFKCAGGIRRPEGCKIEEKFILWNAVLAVKSTQDCLTLLPAWSCPRDVKAH